MAASFKDKVIIVTGSSNGIGTGIALNFAKLGASVTLTGRNAERLQDVRQQCVQAAAAALGGKGKGEDKVLSIRAELTKQDHLKEIVDQTIAKFGKLDVLVNNAGIPNFLSIRDSTPETYDLTMNTNLKAPFFLSKIAIPHLIKTKGSIINISSVVSVIPSEQFIAYGISKAGLNHLTMSLSRDLASNQVRANSLNVGLIGDTQLYRDMPDGTREMILSAAPATTPLGRPGKPQDVANMVEFLADTSKSSWITGATFHVDGGFGTGTQVTQQFNELVGQ